MNCREPPAAPPTIGGTAFGFYVGAGDLTQVLMFVWHTIYCRVPPQLSILISFYASHNASLFCLYFHFRERRFTFGGYFFLLLFVKFKSSAILCFQSIYLYKKKLVWGGLPPSALELGLGMTITLIYIALWSLKRRAFKLLGHKGKQY